MTAAPYSRNQRYGTSLKIALISLSVLVILTVSNVPRRISSLIDDDVHQMTLSPTVSIPYELVNTEHVPTHREKGTLPDFTNGGIIVFYHVYKTGGSTVGKLMHELTQKDQSFYAPTPEDRVSEIRSDGGTENVYGKAMRSKARLFFTMIRKQIDWVEDCVTTVNMAATAKKLVLLELHVEYPAPGFPSLVELAPKIEQWRALADQRGVGFFAFTVMREPVAHALSFFNFFHVGNNFGRDPPSRDDHDYWNPFKPLMSTEKNFLRSYYAHNRQCRMLSTDPQSIFAAPKYLVWNKDKVTKEQVAISRKPCDIDGVHDTFFHSMDWVGTTEMLSNETLPLLTQLVLGDPSVGRKNPPFKVFDNNPSGNVGMKSHNLSDKAMSIILDETELDRSLYADVARSFKLTDLGWDYYSPKDD
mmetsp:Transcript_16255/g.37436  ORF Transcript_16255/g.37436 Transcript_16255/m.37436 type:complete len:416 (+) Transcript_16255:135-1382(+)